MTTVMDIPAELGTYMLRGWILTDSICAQCHKVPLLRSPSASKFPVPPFCVTCNPVPIGGSTMDLLSTNPPKASSSASTSASDTASYESRSTAPTEISDDQEAIEFTPVDTPEALRRRQQSDTAAAEIGKRLLKGWAMLADECPSSECYGVPLVRPPKSGGERDPRKECVICGTVYVDQVDAAGLSSTAPLEVVGRRDPPTSVQDDILAARTGHAAVQVDARGFDGSALTQRPQLPVTIQPSSSQAHSLPVPHAAGISQSSTLSLDHTVLTLEKTLLSLTDRLQLFSSPAGLDITAVGQTADTIAKVSHALLNVKRLQRGDV
ncbi:hypothetical protein EIP91_011055 [Steccherinum ochraceum]|uniref:Uncharacterized protein n=1 Tax=Steccherinum ochraceum TaxID=92696 RepID=A0A4R0S3I6_9APHY|nr:hypothetical protein EIP91_011055 [Steccherinum ochraceum]